MLRISLSALVLFITGCANDTIKPTANSFFPPFMYQTSEGMHLKGQVAKVTYYKPVYTQTEAQPEKAAYVNFDTQGRVIKQRGQATVLEEATGSPHSYVTDFPYENTNAFSKSQFISADGVFFYEGVIAPFDYYDDGKLRIFKSDYYKSINPLINVVGSVSAGIQYTSTGYKVRYVSQGKHLITEVFKYENGQKTAYAIYPGKDAVPVSVDDKAAFLSTPTQEEQWSYRNDRIFTHAIKRPETKKKKAFNSMQLHVYGEQDALISVTETSQSEDDPFTNVVSYDNYVFDQCGNWTSRRMIADSLLAETFIAENGSIQSRKIDYHSPC